MFGYVLIHVFINRFQTCLTFVTSITRKTLAAVAIHIFFTSMSIGTWIARALIFTYKQEWLSNVQMFKCSNAVHLYSAVRNPKVIHGMLQTLHFWKDPPSMSPESVSSTCHLPSVIVLQLPVNLAECTTGCMLCDAILRIILQL